MKTGKNSRDGTSLLRDFMVPVRQGDDSSVIVNIVVAEVGVIRIVNDQRSTETVAVLSGYKTCQKMRSSEKSSNPPT
jgi:hypothetical protein